MKRRYVPEAMLLVLILANVVSYSYIVGRDGWKSVRYDMAYNLRHPQAMANNLRHPRNVFP